MSSTYTSMISTLSPEHKLQFYVILAHELTIAQRTVWSEAHLPPTEHVDQLKWLNEIMHRVLNRVSDLHMPTPCISDDSLWAVITSHVEQNRAIAGLVGHAIEVSYKLVTQHPWPSSAA